MKNKIKLDQLRIESFVTSLTAQERIKIVAGKATITLGCAPSFGGGPPYCTDGGTCNATTCAGPTLTSSDCGIG